jgi:hypothetical protein
MAAKSALTVIGLVMIAQGILFYVFKEVITLDMFPGVNKEALRVGEIMRELLAAGSMFIGVILFLARTNVNSAAKRILFGASIGFVILLGVLVHISITNDDINTPMLPLILFSLFAVISFSYGESGLRDRRR